jgi:hypothetical protein
MKIKIIISLIYFCSSLHAMDEATKPTIKPNRVLATTNPNDEFIVIPPKYKRKDKKRAFSEAERNTNEVIIPMRIENKKEKRKSIIPPLDLQAAYNIPSNGSESSSKKTVRDYEVLKKATSEKITSHGQRHAGSGDITTKRGHITRSRPEHEVVEGDDTPLHKSSSTIAHRLSSDLSVGDEKTYTETEVLAMLTKSSPQLMRFANEHSMTLEEILTFADLLEEIEIDPCVIIEYVTQNISGKQMSKFDQGLAYLFRESQGKSADRLIKDLTDMKQQNPDNYKVMVLELMKAAYQEANGIDKRSVIADTHASLQNNQIDEQASSLRKQMLGNILQFLLTIGTTVWAVYGQVNNGACPGNSTA